MKKISLLFAIVVMMLLFAFSASAETEGYYTYSIYGSEAAITDVDETISGDITIPETLGGYPVTIIGIFSFQDCDSLTSITIPDSVTSIDGYAFSHCDSLTSVTIPNSVISIGYDAFSHCISLISITIPNSVTYIHSYAFSCCDSLTSITVDKNNPNFSNDEYGVLFDKEKATLIQYPVGNTRSSYTIPDSAISVCGYAFSCCDSLTSITIPDSVTSIGGSAFRDCDSLTNIIIPDNITTISGGTFYSCSNLTSVTIPDSVTSIDDSAFRDCDSLSSITIPNSVTSIGQYTFESCDSLSSATIGDSVTSIGIYAFSCCGSLTSITIPNSVTSIGQSMFEFCYSLTSITIPNSVTSIGYEAFYKCSSLTSLIIPDSVTFIGDRALYDCSSLTSIIIGDSVTSIGESTFESCDSLLSVTIGDSVTFIGKYAFQYCYGLTSITIPKNVTSIGIRAFYDCDSLTNITIPNSVTSVGSYAFESCDSLTNITIPAGVTSIERGTFYRCDSLTNITIPNSVTSIGSYAFESCDSLTNITIPAGVTSIERGTFYHCDSLTSVTIPNSVTSIGQSAFAYCDSLSSVTIGDSVTSIDEDAFWDCNSLTDVYYTGTSEKWNSISIGSNNINLINATIHYNYISTTDNSSLKITQSPIIISPEDSTEYLVTAVYYDKNGNNILDADIKWTISDSSVIELLEFQNGFNSNVTFKAKNIGSTKLTAHYNGKTAECCIFVKEIEPQLSVEVNNLVQNENTFTFDVVYGNWFGIDSSSLTEQQREKATATGCYAELTLPKGFSFSQNEEERNLTYMVLNDGALIPGESKKFSCTIYKIQDDAENKMTVTAKASNSSDSKKVVKLFVDGRDLTEEDRKAIKDDVKVIIDVAKGYKKIQQRGGKIEYGQYTASKDFTGNEIPIEVTISNFIPSKYFEYEEYLKNNSEFDYNIFSLDVSNVEGFKSVTIDKSSMKDTLKAGESITLYGKAVLANNYLPMPEDEQSRELSASVEAITLSGDKRVNNFNLTVKNISYKPKVANVTAAAKELANAPNTVCNLNCLAADFGISLKQCEHISKLVTIQLAMFALPEDSLREKIDKKALKKLFGYEEIIGGKRGAFTVTIPLTVNGEKIEIDLINTVTVSEFNGTVNAKFDSVTYNAYKLTKNWLGKEKREAEPYKNGVAGIAAYANIDKLISSVEDYVLDAVSSVTDTALGDTDDAAEFLFGKCANDVLVEAGYESFFDYGWSVYSNAWKTVTVECPVDVYVYNSNDELCGTIINNVPTEISDEVELEVENDDKIVKLWGNGYYIKTVATAEGTMSISVSENDYNNGPRRIVRYTNMPLSVGAEYQQNYGEGLNVDSSVYDVLYEDDSIQFADDEIMLLTDNFCLHENTHFTGGSAATCTTAGKTQDEYCLDCSRIIAEGIVIDKLGHSMSSNIVIEQPSCTEKGVGVAVCSRCDYTGYNEIPANGHTYSSTYTVDKVATCTSAGSKSKHCINSGCTAKISVTSIGKLVHTYTNACDKECNVCRAKRTTKHTYTNSCDTDCNVCKAKRTITHTVITLPAKSPTYLKTGLTEGKKCKVCGKVTVAQKTVAKKKLSKVKIKKAKSTKKKILSLVWGKVSGATRYQIQYSTSKSFKKKTTKTAKSTKLTVKKLKSKKTYYVRVRAYRTENGKKVYSSWSTVKKVKIK